MDRDTLLGLIDSHGALRMASAVANFSIPAQLGEGWDLTNWCVSDTPGAVLFTVYDGPRPHSVERAALLAEQATAEVRRHQLRAVRYHDPAARREAERVQNRLNIIGHELAALSADDPAHTPVAGVLVVNADDTPESRATYEPMVAEQPYPVALVFQPAAPF